MASRNVVLLFNTEYHFCVCHSWSFYSGKFKSIQSMSLPVWLPQEIENLQKSLETAKKDHRLGVGCPVQVQDCTLFRSKGICSKRCCRGSFRHSFCWSGAINYLLNGVFFSSELFFQIWESQASNVSPLFVLITHQLGSYQPPNFNLKWLANWAQFIVCIWQSQEAISSWFP